MRNRLVRTGKARGSSQNKGAQKKGTAKTSVSKKRPSNKHTRGSGNIIGIGRSRRSLLTSERHTRVLSEAGTVAPPVLTTIEEKAIGLAPAEHPSVPKNPTPGLTKSDTVVPPPPTTLPESSKSPVHHNPTILWKNRDGVLIPAGIASPYASNTMAVPFWCTAMKGTTAVAPRALSLFSWRNYRLRKQQKRMALEMLVVNGSVRESRVEFRYSTDPEDTGTLCRSFAVEPLSAENLPPTPLQALTAKLRAYGIQLIRSPRVQETYARLQSLGQQLIEWLRRELTPSSYPSRI